MKSEIAGIVDELALRDQFIDANRIKDWLVDPTSVTALELASVLQEQSFVTISRVLAFLASVDADGFRRLLNEMFALILLDEPDSNPSFNVSRGGNREILAMAVRHYPNVPELKDILFRFARSPDATLNAVAFERLPELGDYEAVDLLESGLRHKSGEVRALAVEGLRKVQIDVLLPHVNQLLRDENRFVRQAIAGLLGEVDSMYRDEIIRMLRFDEDHEVMLIIDDFLRQS